MNRLTRDDASVLAEAYKKVTQRVLNEMMPDYEFGGIEAEDPKTADTMMTFLLDTGHSIDKEGRPSYDKFHMFKNKIEQYIKATEGFRLDQTEWREGESQSDVEERLHNKLHTTVKWCVELGKLIVQDLKRRKKLSFNTPAEYREYIAKNLMPKLVVASGKPVFKFEGQNPHIARNVLDALQAAGVVRVSKGGRGSSGPTYEELAADTGT